jgi:hypothetical protein
MSASEKLKALERNANRWQGSPDPADHGGRPYTPNERKIGYGTPMDPRIPEMSRAVYQALRALPQIVAVTSAAEKLYAEAATTAPLWDEINDALIALDKALNA